MAPAVTIADLVARLIAAGAAPDVAAVAVTDAFALGVVSTGQSGGGRVDAVAEKRRAWEREYRKNLRKEARKQTMSGIILSGGQSGGHGAERCSLSSSLLPSVASLGSKKRSSEPRARGSRLTDDWQPREEDREFVRGLGVDPAALRDEFVDFWTAVPGSRGLKLDWYKTYKNRAREIAGRRKGRTNGKSVIDAQDRLNAKLAEFSEPDLLPGIRGEASPPDVRLFPTRRSG